MPTFPLKCEFCSATHNGDATKALNDGWVFGAFDTEKHGKVQKAGCPKHTKEIWALLKEFVTKNPETLNGNWHKGRMGNG